MGAFICFNVTELGKSKELTMSRLIYWTPLQRLSELRQLKLEADSGSTSGLRIDFSMKEISG